MSEIVLRLVHSRSFVGHADDLAIILLASAAGLMMQFILLAVGFGLPLD